uniref:Nucleolar pre-ribosomal-associated protein 1 n=2 Tax=Schistocephalus solidus TaxID=70667 RepID=A0A0X3P9X5_SCHSO
MELKNRTKQRLLSKKREAPCEDEHHTTKKPKQEDLSVLTSDPTGLAVFLKRIEAETECDVVYQYLSTQTGEEILALLEAGYERKFNELTVILKVLAILVLRTNTDLAKEFASVGKRIAEGVLEEAPLAACLRALRPSGSAEAAKASLQLLAAVVSTSPLLGRSLLRSLNFDHADWVQCSRRRNTKDQCDVRTCFINFLAAFFAAGHNVLIREVLEAKNAMHLLISECFTDKLSNVLLTLTLLRTKVVENATVSKTIKMRIFTRSALKQLAYLYAWRGEALTAKVALSRSDTEVDQQAVELVRTAVHKLLHALCSSSLYGLVFRERMSSDASIQNNHLLHLLLSPPMHNAFTDPLRRQLVVDCLLACPSLLPGYLSHWQTSLEPRDSDNWRDLIYFVQEILATFQRHIVNRALQLVEITEDIVNFVHSISNLCLPPVCLSEPLRLASQVEETRIRKPANAIFKTLRRNLVIFLTWTHFSEDLVKKGASSSMIVSELSKLLPERVLVAKWFGRFSKTLHTEQTDQAILADQVTSIVETETEVDEEALVKTASTQPTDEEEISMLPKGIQKTMLILLGHSREPSRPLSEKHFKKLTKKWPELVKCLEHLHTIPVVYTCLSAGIRLLSSPENRERVGWTSFSRKSTSVDEVLCPTPKTILKTLSKQPEVFSHLLGRERLEDEEKEVTDIPPSLTNPSRLKDGLATLLLSVSEIVPQTAAKSLSLLSLLSVYSAQMTLCDRNLLQLMFILDSSGQPLTNIWGMTNGCLIWGDRISDHYRLGKTLRDVPTLWRQPNISAFLNLLDKDKLLTSAFAFPVSRRCLAQSGSVDRTLLKADLYDPCFLLPLFLRYLSIGHDTEQDIPRGVDLRGFYSRNCLAFAVAALSSYSRHLRGLAKAVIARYRQLLEIWKPTKVPNVPVSLAVMKQFPERVQINFILDTIRNSLSDKADEIGGGFRHRFLFGSRADTSFRLTRVHANFFVHALLMLNKPEHRMYEVFWNCLLAKPAVDLGTVPDFMRTIFSIHEDHRIERQWMIKLCAETVNDTSDYLLLEKSRVFKYCLTMYSDPSIDSATQVQILRLLVATTKIPRACHALTRFHAFPLWLFRHALGSKHTPFLSYFFQIIKQMLAAFEETKEESPALPILKLLDSTFRNLHGATTFTEKEVQPVDA